MENLSVADSRPPDERRKPPLSANDHRAELSVVTEMDLISGEFPISRVRWRPLLAPRGD